MRAERDLIIKIAMARHHAGQVVEYALAKTVHESEPMRGGEIDSRLPFRVATFEIRR